MKRKQSCHCLFLHCEQAVLLFSVGIVFLYSLSLYNEINFLYKQSNNTQHAGLMWPCVSGNFVIKI